MLKKENTLLLVVDIQGKLAQAMYEKEKLFDNLARLIKGIRVLDIPVVWAEQVPEKLGPTIPEVAELLGTEMKPIPKNTFSCCSDWAIMEKIERTGRTQVLICGIEAHICIYQTAYHLIRREFDVQVVADAVSSRTQENRELGLQRIVHEGGKLTSVEMALFELLKAAEGDAFREIAKIVK